MSNNNQNKQDNSQIQIRREKLDALQQAGKDPFAITTFDRTHYSRQIIDNYDEFEGKEVCVAGRQMFKRVMGKASFCNIRDIQGDIQVYVARDEIGEESYADFKKSDIGDIYGVKGTAFKTKTGEISIHAKEMTLLTKSLQVLPEKFHGLTDVDTRYRQRYVDLTMNLDVRETFIKRTKILRAIRQFMDDRGFLEVETPIMVENAGGAAARPFFTHFNALNEDFKLRISLELPLKKLIVGGLEGVYEIGRVFRNEGLDTRHNPEFTEMEFYQAYTDYNGMMRHTEEMFRYICQEVNGTLKVPFGEHIIDFESPWKVITMEDAVKEYAGVDFTQIKDTEEAKKIADEHNIEYEDYDTKGMILAYFFEEYAEDKLIQPTFVIDHPIEISPLTKKKPGRPDLVERFELFINGWEFANAYSEINDPIDQRERFAAQEKRLSEGDDETTYESDYDFINALDVGMPPTGGIGYGIDRLVMIMTNSMAIRDVLLFPTMKTLGKQANQGKEGNAETKVSAKKEDPHKPAITRDEALELLKKYNSEEFHIQHAYTVEGVMRYFAKERGYNEDFWGMVGLLHDIDFEKYPDEHCIKAPELLREGGVAEDMIHAIVCHAYGFGGVDVVPEHEMEKLLYATDELTGLIWACALMRPSKSTKDLELKSLKKKYKSKGFAAGVDRSVIEKGAEMLGMELDDLLEATILAMRACEDDVAATMA